MQRVKRLLGSQARVKDRDVQAQPSVFASATASVAARRPTGVDPASDSNPSSNAAAATTALWPQHARTWADPDVRAKHDLLRAGIESRCAISAELNTSSALHCRAPEDECMVSRDLHTRALCYHSVVLRPHAVDFFEPLHMFVPMPSIDGCTGRVQSGAAAVDLELLSPQSRCAQPQRRQFPSAVLPGGGCCAANVWTRPDASTRCAHECGTCSQAHRVSAVLHLCSTLLRAPEHLDGLRLQCTCCVLFVTNTSSCQCRTDVCIPSMLCILCHVRLACMLELFSKLLCRLV